MKWYCEDCCAYRFDGQAIACPDCCGYKIAEATPTVEARRCPDCLAAAVKS